jgi:hypothetical protein
MRYTSSKFTGIDLHLLQINLYCHVYLTDENALDYATYPCTSLRVYVKQIDTYGRAHAARLSVLDETVSSTLQADCHLTHLAEMSALACIYRTVWSWLSRIENMDAWIVWARKIVILPSLLSFSWTTCRQQIVSGRKERSVLVIMATVRGVTLLRNILTTVEFPWVVS